MASRLQNTVHMMKQAFRFLATSSFLIITFSACDISWVELGSTSCNFVTNGNGQRISWKSSLPIKFRIHEDVPESAYSSIYKAIDIWNQVSSKKVISIVSTNYKPQPSVRDQIPAIYWRTSWDPKKPMEQARTTVRWMQSQLLDADIMINAQNFRYFMEDEIAVANKVDLVGVMVHELGHALGFAHNEAQESVMYYQLRKGYERRNGNKGLIFHATDVSSYQCEYGDDIVLASFANAINFGETGVASGASSM